MDSPLARIVVLSLTVLAGCEAPVAPTTEGVTGDVTVPLVGAFDREDQACARRVEIRRETRARVNTGPGNFSLYFDAKKTKSGSGLFNVSEGVSDGADGNGAQSWVKQFTNVECSSWSIADVEMLLMEGSGTGEAQAEANFEVCLDDKQRPGAHAHSVVDITFELEQSAEFKFRADLSGQAVQSGGLAAGALVEAYVKRLAPAPSVVLSSGGVDVEGDEDSTPTDVLYMAGNLAPGRYQLWVGVRKEGWVSVFSTWPVAVGSGAAEGKWAFQFKLKEGP